MCRRNHIADLLCLRPARFETVTYRGEDPHHLTYAYGVHGYPTVVYIDKNGKYAGKDVGAGPADDFEKKVNDLIAGRKITTRD